MKLRIVTRCLKCSQANSHDENDSIVDLTDESGHFGGAGWLTHVITSIETECPNCGNQHSIEHEKFDGITTCDAEGCEIDDLEIEHYDEDDCETYSASEDMLAEEC